MCTCAFFFNGMVTLPLLPLRSEHSQVALVAPLGVLLSGGEQLIRSLFRELFCYGSEAPFTLAVVLYIPLRLFGVNGSCLLPRLPDYNARGAICCALGGSAASLRAKRASHTPHGFRARSAHTARLRSLPHTPSTGMQSWAFKLRLVNFNSHARALHAAYINVHSFLINKGL